MGRERASLDGLEFTVYPALAIQEVTVATLNTPSNEHIAVGRQPYLEELRAPKMNIAEG